ncbi:hypothetical protein [Mycoplasmopsis felis]|uniref:Uncharacterized protein n=1 Tax=Mycoplasmopsis felis TaxID=33923 RepID=A0A809RTX0_9BACT|nr:hypothetical protein [Mycoplasmopsis felis]WQQ03608.1 hypothetical protein RRG47_02030 [Mycoplasmopsis felis]WQQ05025.1 hypothetical protein RRG55_01735 [Mycoplasmopsis felis]WQQ05637.1 hypothetical protein RRG59_00800 [Mycoplasmopsis felis]WQQ06028.1 hypothetical protein RRG40_02920 [Mycoplasmopsis felis]WQQ07225.1 hypothetical protein RRG37_01225 [Mycoplasmopsis felis]
MKINNNEIIKKFNELAYKLNFVYSLFQHSLNQFINDGIIEPPINVIVNHNTLIKLKNYKTNFLKIQKKYASDICLPFIEIENQKIYLNLLIPSSYINLNNNKTTTKLKYINKGKLHFLYELIDNLYSENPEVWAFIYFDIANALLKIKPITNINPNYYKTIKNNNLELPYINIKI